jgi:hypothetical protein
LYQVWSEIIAYAALGPELLLGLLSRGCRIDRHWLLPVCPFQERITDLESAGNIRVLVEVNVGKGVHHAVA